MTSKVNRQWLLKQRPQGLFKDDDFELQEQSVAELKPGQALVQTLYLSFDPTQRGWAAVDTYMEAVPLKTPMRAMGIGQVIESQSKKYQTGDLVLGLLNWQEYALVSEHNQGLFSPSVLPGFMNPELTLALALTGLTAYFGLLDIGKPKAGETVLVSGAAGATGSIVAQIARIKGARVVGIAGGQEKCRWLKDVAKVDEVIDYKNEDVLSRIQQTCPNGVDVYYDNVGGPTLDAALLNLAMGARVVICGGISDYDKFTQDPLEPMKDNYGVRGYLALINARAKMEGFIVADYTKRYPEGLMVLNKWIDQGKLVQEIDLQQGFDNIPATMRRIFEGKNIGKQLLKLADPPLPMNVNPVTQTLFKLMQNVMAWRKG